MTKAEVHLWESELIPSLWGGTVDPQNRGIEDNFGMHVARGCAGTVSKERRGAGVTGTPVVPALL